MNKKNVVYASVWLAVLVLFNVLVFGLPCYLSKNNEIVSKLFYTSEGSRIYTPAFWPCYIFVTLTLVCNLICAMIVLYKGNEKKIYLNISAFIYSCASVVAIFSVSIAALLKPSFMQRSSIVVCGCVFFSNIAVVIKAMISSLLVGRIDDKISEETQNMEEVRLKLENAIKQADDIEDRKKIKSVYEKIKYIDYKTFSGEKGERAKNELFDALREKDYEKIESIIIEIKNTEVGKQ